MAVPVLHVCDKFGVAGSSIHGVSRLFSWWFPRFDPARFDVGLVGLKGPEPASRLLAESGIPVHHLGRGKFDPRIAMSPRLLGSLLDSVEKRFPDMKGPLAEARAGRYGAGAIEALTSGDQAVAAFLKGLDWYSKGQLNQAVTQLEKKSRTNWDTDTVLATVWELHAEVGADSHHLVLAQLVHTPAIDPHSPAVGLQQPGDDFERCRLA